MATVNEIAIATGAMDEAHRLVVPLACYCQLRRSEVLGLQRKHIDLEQSTLRVEQAWTVSGGAMHLGPPKTEAGRRDVPIPANVLPVLIDHLERFVDEGVEGWLFPGHGGSVVSARTLDRQWAIARETIGRPDLHFHDLRHTGLTLVAMTGATIAEIKAAGGHDSSAAAIRYQHATPQRKTAIADALAAIADGRIESLSPTKGHAGGTTPAADAPDEDVSEPSTSVSNHPNRTHHARRHRPRRRKSPGHSTGSEERPPLRSTQDTSPSATSSDTRDEQPQRDSNPCRHLESAFVPFSRVGWNR